MQPDNGEPVTREHYQPETPGREEWWPTGADALMAQRTIDGVTSPWRFSLDGRTWYERTAIERDGCVLMQRVEP